MNFVKIYSGLISASLVAHNGTEILGVSLHGNYARMSRYPRDVKNTLYYKLYLEGKAKRPYYTRIVNTYELDIPNPPAIRALFNIKCDPSNPFLPHMPPIFQEKHGYVMVTILLDSLFVTMQANYIPVTMFNDRGEYIMLSKQIHYGRTVFDDFGNDILERLKDAHKKGKTAISTNKGYLIFGMINNDAEKLFVALLATRMEAILNGSTYIIIGVIICAFLIAFVIFSLFFRAYYLRKEIQHVKILNNNLDLEKQNVIEQQMKYRQLLNSMAPDYIVQRLLAGEEKIGDKINKMTFIFIDLVGFSELSKSISAIALVEYLGNIFQLFDTFAEIFGIYKVKTIGDCYFGIIGLHNEPLQAIRMLKFAFTIQFFFNYILPHHNDPYLNTLQVRIGVHCGSAICGVLTGKTPHFDCWSSDVNFASRLESTGIPGKVHVSQTVRDAIIEEGLDDFFTFENRTISVKGFGYLISFFVYCDNYNLVLPKNFEQILREKNWL